MLDVLTQLFDSTRQSLPHTKHAWVSLYETLKTEVREIPNIDSGVTISAIPLAGAYPWRGHPTISGYRIAIRTLLSKSHTSRRHSGVVKPHQQLDYPQIHESVLTRETPAIDPALSHLPLRHGVWCKWSRRRRWKGLCRLSGMVRLCGRRFTSKQLDPLVGQHQPTSVPH